ncbi:MAG: formylglycine-generating enzyme family protein [Phycisphaerales bacterium JB037]
MTAITVAAGLGMAHASPIVVPTVPVGLAGNAPDASTGYGSVGYDFRISSTEVTNAQYAQFLNAVGASDPNNLYNTQMAGAFGGIVRSGSPGSYSYATVSGRASHPVNYVSFWDAARFANWLHNGQPSGAQSAGTTEDGAYTLTPAGITSNSVTRNTSWQWAVTSSDEWYKAAFYQPALAGGDADDYWLYPTSSNTAPTGLQANYLPSGINNTTATGSYAPNFFGVYDMAGNVYEWSDSGIGPIARGPLWGGAFDNIAGWLTPANAYTPPPIAEREQLGFRVVQVPAPGSATLLALGGLGMLRRSRRR